MSVGSQHVFEARGLGAAALETLPGYTIPRNDKARKGTIIGVTPCKGNPEVVDSEEYQKPIQSEEVHNE